MTTPCCLKCLGSITVEMCVLHMMHFLLRQDVGMELNVEEDQSKV